MTTPEEQPCACLIVTPHSGRDADVYYHTKMKLSSGFLHVEICSVFCINILNDERPHT